MDTFQVPVKIPVCVPFRESGSIPAKQELIRRVRSREVM